MNESDFKQELSKILNYIEENIRTTEQTKINFIDPRGHIERLKNKQNQIIFGRRGSGKTLLLQSIKNKTDLFICLIINLEDFKDISFPDSIIQVLKELLSQLETKCDKDYSFWKIHRLLKHKKCKKQIKSYLKQFDEWLSQPDNYDASIRTKKAGSITGGFGANLNKNNASISAETSEEIEINKSFNIQKLNNLKNQISNIKKILNGISNYFNKPIFLILDDFYFIKRNDQPEFIDFFHRLSKNTNLYLKVATIKHRTSLYKKDETIYGIELGHDAQSLCLDYNLDDFDALSAFMKDLLQSIKEEVQANIDMNNILSTNAFKFLCFASGGVPRDFFSLFIRLGNKFNTGHQSISKTDVIEVAIENLPNKLDAFKTDTKDENEILEHYLQHIKNEIIAIKKTNVFLVSNSDIANYSQIQQAIKELVDLRLLHLINPNLSSAPSDGKRYSAYMVDIGLFPNSKPQNFKQIEPGDKDSEGREDKVRSAPKLNLSKYKEYIDSLHISNELIETDY